MTDHAKRLAEIEARHAAIEAGALADMEHRDGEDPHEDRGVLLAQVRRLSRPAPTDLADIRERAAAPEVTWSMGLDRQDRLALLRVIDESHAALDALGVAPGGLAERVRALGVLAGRGPATESDDVSTAHLRALEIVAYSDGTAVQLALAKELVGMGAEAVAEAVCRAYEEGRAAEARRPSRKRCDVCGRSDGLHWYHPDPAEDEPSTGLDVAAAPARRAAFNAYPGMPPRLAVLDPSTHPLRPAAARMREHLNNHPDLCLADSPISLADLATALRISEEDMRAIEAGQKTTDEAGWAEIQTALFSLGGGMKAEDLADPIGSGALDRALAAYDDEPTSDREPDPCPEAPEGFPSAGAGFCRGLAAPPPEPDIEPAVGDGPEP